MLIGRTVLDWRKVRVRLLEWEFGSEDESDLTLWDATTAALKIEFKSEKFGLLLLSGCAAIKSEK